MAKTAPKAAEDQLLQLDPKNIEAAGNAVRFGTSPLRTQIDALKASIVAQGRVNDPVEVEPTPVKGKFKLTVGFGRHFAVTELNKAGAGLLLPAIVRTPTDAKARLVRQLSENVDRQSLTLMDTATAIKALLDQGYSKPEVRALFPRAAGRKGKTLELAPASNSWLNIMVSFLSLPAEIQALLHDGTLGMAAGYELTKSDPAKQKAVIEKALSNRQAELDREAAADEKLAKAEEKASKQTESTEAKAKKAADAEAALTVAEQAAIDADAAVETKRADLKKMGSMSQADFALLETAEKKAQGEKIAAAKADFQSALKLANDAKKARDKAQQALVKLTDKAETKPEAAPKAKPAAAPKKAIGAREVKVAAAEVAAGKAAPATVADIRKAAMALGGSRFKGARAIGAAWLTFIDGKQSMGALVTAVEVSTGERKTAKA